MARRNTLGASRLQHAKAARAPYNYATKGFTNARQAAESGRCARALDAFAVANQDFGEFLIQARNATGAQARGVMSLPRMKQRLGSARLDTLEAIKRSCLR